MYTIKNNVCNLQENFNHHFIPFKENDKIKKGKKGKRKMKIKIFTICWKAAIHTHILAQQSLSYLQTYFYQTMSYIMYIYFHILLLKLSSNAIYFEWHPHLRVHYTLNISTE